LRQIKNKLENGISVCIFVSDSNLVTKIDRLIHSYSFKEILENSDFSIVQVIIQKGEKSTPSTLWDRWLKKFRTPASISFGDSIKHEHISSPLATLES
jgi:acyl-[acyl-carrier-protein]-phospholipid O-acyltransferase/long-chain-fatty-acid--[acyl-carrier-protein] ligase